MGRKKKKLSPEQRARKTARQRELRKLNPERYRAYDRTPVREFAKKVYNWQRKFSAMRLVQPHGQIACKICGQDNFLALTIDHVDESGSEANLYHNLVTKRSSPKDKQILCYSCNAVLRVLGHDDEEKINNFVLQYNEARKRAIEAGSIDPANFPELTKDDAIKMTGRI